MARRAAAESIDQIILDAMHGVVAKTSQAIQRRIDERVAAELKSSRPARGRGERVRTRRQGRRARVEMTRWVADNRARRVPNFVIELTGGLDTKKKIVARFGPGVVFEKGKPVPTPKMDGANSVTPLAAEPKAKRPMVRKKAAAAK
jgi:hypothetical protein